MKKKNSVKQKKRLKIYVLLENNQPKMNAHPSKKHAHRIPLAKYKSAQYAERNMNVYRVKKNLRRFHLIWIIRAIRIKEGLAQKYILLIKRLLESWFGFFV